MLNFAFALLFLFQQSDMAEVSGDTQTVVGPVATLTGAAVVTYQDLRVEADSITYNRDTYDLTAEGHVKFTRGEERLEGEGLALNVRTKAGTLSRVSGYIGPGYYFTASDVRRYADGRYELHNATVTTCGETDPGWTLKFKRASIVPGRSVTAGGSVFRLEGLPLFYFPYLVVPTANRERSTGFLIPSTSTSTSKGRSVRETFYYAINRSADATFTAQYFTKRGPAGEVNFRAVPNATSYAEVTAFFVRDREGKGGQSARILNYTDLGKGYRAVSDMNLVSSFVFRQVFEEGFSLISSPIEHSLAFLTRNRPAYSYNILYHRSGIFLCNREVTCLIPDQPTVISRKLPDLDVSVPERKIAGLPAYFALRASAGAISRRDAAIRSRGFIGRVDLQPVLEISAIQNSIVEWSHQVGVRETFYSQRIPGTGPPATLNRFLLDYSTRVIGPQLERSFGRWRHIVEPSVDYRYIKGADRFRSTVVVDEVDLVTDTNEVEYAITNRVFTSREVFSWRIGQQYYFDPTFGGAVRQGVRNPIAPLLNITGFAFADGRRRFSPIVSNMRLSTSVNTSTDLQVDYDSERHRFESAGVSGGVSRGQTFGNIAYFFRRPTTIQFSSNQLRGNFGYGSELKPGLSFVLSAAYNAQNRVFQESVVQLGYNLDCYGLGLEWMQVDLGDRKESRIRFGFSLKNIGSFGNIRRQDRIF